MWFGIVAGVRGPPHFEAKGFPDIKCDVLQDFVKSDGYGYHSTTWLTLKELCEANEVFLKLALEQHPDEGWPEPGDIYQRIPKADDIVNKLIINLGYEGTSIPWAGTLQQFIGEENSIEDCVLYVCAFDS